jgi:transcriptional regulator GlxA family with amidase domain
MTLRRATDLHADIDRIRLARTLIDTRFDTPISLDELAHVAGFSMYHFIRIFRHVYKQTPHQCLVMHRVDKAKHLLRSTDLSVTDICFDVGFQSVGSFSATFRKLTGLSPSSYREHAAPLPPRPYIPLCYRIRYDIRDPDEI